MSNTATAAKKVSLPAPPDPERMDVRSVRARTEPMAVTPFGGGVYEVDSASGHSYLVDLESGRCTCPDHVMRQARCKHVRRVAIEINEGRVPPPGKERGACAFCGRDIFVPEDDPGAHLCARCELRPGDAVVDRETGDVVIVVNPTDKRANVVGIPGQEGTVAEYPSNAAYNPADPVVEVIYPLPANLDSDDVKPYHLRRYSFPLSRLRRRSAHPDQARLTDFAA